MWRATILAAVLFADVSPRAERFRPESARLQATIRVAGSCFEFTRDARRMVVLTPDGNLAVWDVGARREIRRTPGPFRQTRLQLSADGTRALMASSDRKTVKLVDVERGQELKTYTDVFASFMQAYVLSPDGRRVALANRDQSVRIFDAVTGTEVKTLLEPSVGPGGQCGSMAWAPNGKTLAVHGWDGTLRLFDATSGKILGANAGVGRSPLYLGFAPDSATLAVVTQEARLQLFDKEFRPIRAVDETITGSRVLAFSPDGQLMAGADFFGKIRIWDTRTWKRLRDLDAGSVRHLAFSPDGRHLGLMTFDGEVRLWGGSGAPVPPGKVAAPRGGAPGFLGISGDTTEGDEAGVVILSVIEGTAAEKAGLKVGDRIVRIGANATDSFEALRTVVLALREGDEVEIVYRRGDAERRARIKLGSRPAGE